MLKAEENRVLTQVGPATPMGKLMRQYWIPALLSAELPQPDGDPIRVRLLGVDLVAFRDTSGRIGLVGALCPHRGTPLYFGRNEHHGLRCVYHGWKFDIQGSCVDMPNVPPESDFKHKVRHAAYPCVERAGVVWTYMGPLDPPPQLPALEWIDLPAEYRIISKQYLYCSFAQAMEGDFDPSHISFLHSTLEAFRQFEALTSGDEGSGNGHAPEPDGELTPELEELYWKLDPRPLVMVMQTDYGLFSGARRKAGQDTYYYRFNHFIMPFYAGIPRDVGAQGQTNIWVPVDDEHTLVWRITYRSERPFTDEERAKELNGLDVHLPPQGYLPATSEAWSQWIPKLNRSNDYGLDREAQRTLAFSGLPGIWAQDRACTEGMGAIMDRTTEHLASSDVAVIQMRRMLINAATELDQYGTRPPGLDELPIASAIRTRLLERDLAWEQVVDIVSSEVREHPAKVAGAETRSTGGG